MSDNTEHFLCIAKGEALHLEELKKCIQDYVEKGSISLITATINKKEVHILTKKEWENYQTLKKREDKLMGAWFP